jgi:flagellin
MSSILTNNSAMVALQTMKKINSNMAMTQSEISTGKSVSNAKDNAAVWAISKVMESDVKGFKGISDSLNLGSSTVAVAREAAETVTDLLTEMKGKIVAAQEGNVDRAKIQTDVAKLREQIGSVVGAAQFNGLNLVDGSAGGSVNVLSSLDRSASGVTASAISVTTQNLSIGGYSAKSVFADAGTAVAGTTVGAAGDTLTMNLDATTGVGGFTISGTEAAPIWAAGDQMSMRFGDKTATYTVKASDLAADNSPADMIAVGMKSAIEALGIAGLSVNYDSSAAGELAFTNTSATGISVSAQFKNVGSGGLGNLSAIDVSTALGANQALGAIDDLLETLYLPKVFLNKVNYGSFRLHIELISAPIYTPKAKIWQE